MVQVVIENPILNSPFKEPKKHGRFVDDGISLGCPQCNHHCRLAGVFFQE